MCKIEQRTFRGLKLTAGVPKVLSSVLLDSRFLSMMLLKILGLWIQNDLKWQTQVDVMLKKAHNLFMLRSLKIVGFCQDELTVAYKSYVTPVIEYPGMLMWFGIQGSHTNRLVT